MNGNPEIAALPVLEPLFDNSKSKVKVITFPILVYLPVCAAYVIPVEPPPNVMAGVKEVD